MLNSRKLPIEKVGFTPETLRSSNEQGLAPQILANEEEPIRLSVKKLEIWGAEAIDINMGCPVSRIAESGAGAGMMCNVDGSVDLVRHVVSASRVPISVKMRLGWDDSQITAPMFAQKFEDAGVCAVAIHGRTRAQGFGGQVSLPGIRKVVEAVRSIPVIGNGDIRSVADAARMLSETGCHGVSIGRAALANPWIFRQLSEWETTGTWSPAGTFDERLNLMMQQFDCLAERNGIPRAIILFRKMAHWYLKGMRVRKALRGDFQKVCTEQEMATALAQIREEGPVDGNRSGILTDVHIHVPSGPVEQW
ncbi:MAG: tRNA dihydrouridine synthase [Planctomyces sp.]